MRVVVKKSNADVVADAALVLTCFQGTSAPEMRCGTIAPLIARLIESGEFGGKLLQTALIHTEGKHPSARILLVGLGKKEEFYRDIIRQAVTKAVHFLSDIGVKSFSIALPPADIPPEDSAACIAEGAILANYSFTSFKTPEKEEPKKEIDEVTIIVGEKERAVADSVSRAVITAEAANYARELANTPANIATPAYMAGVARRLAKECKLKISVYGKEQLRKMGFNALLSVASGSAQPPYLVVLEHNAGKGLPSICLVGKGITFDAGGISLKPSEGMEKMKWDKSGACAVLGVMRAVSRLGLPLHVIALLPFTENLPSGKASRPGDIVRAVDKKTIEIVNTDAEGRLILADTIAFACQKFKPRALIDIATLTGAVLVALGSQCAAVLGDSELVGPLKAAGEATHERLWELPLWKDYFEYMKSANADIANISQYKEAGTITGAVFLKKFVPEEVKWAHIDIAGVAWMERDRHYWRKGSATGFGVRLLTKFLESWRG
ncbi:MAG: leucyl aminopeptidase [Candidatus Micrarchaeia archaeon]